jgi:hypothetical protein
LMLVEVMMAKVAACSLRSLNTKRKKTVVVSQERRQTQKTGGGPVVAVIDCE